MTKVNSEHSAEDLNIVFYILIAFFLIIIACRILYNCVSSFILLRPSPANEVIAEFHLPQLNQNLPVPIAPFG